MIQAVVPGDKSIAHRFLILATLADGESVLSGIPASLDVESTFSCLVALGASLKDRGDGLVEVRGPSQWRFPPLALDCANSGTTARLLTGLLVGLGIEAELRGDASLSGRPMDRVVYPLQAMGGRIQYTDLPGRLPLRVESRVSGDLRALRYRPRVSSAQVRAALLLAALAGRTDVEILDRLRPRDHTERILRSMGAPVVTQAEGSGERIRFAASRWDGALNPLSVSVPGDISSAAFLVVAALLSGRELTIESVGLNPTRMGFVKLLSSMGADIQTRETGVQAGEPAGSLTVRSCGLEPFDIGENLVPSLIDEVPALAVLASRLQGVSVLRGAAELRVKESDRLKLIAGNLQHLGVHCDELDDGLRVYGSRAALAGTVRTGGDHRIAMAFGALGAAPGCEIALDDRDCVNVSYPGFWEALSRVAGLEEDT